MDNIKRIENYIPIPLLFLLLIFVDAPTIYISVFITFYILVGLILVINAWRMYEEELDLTNKWNFTYYLIYVFILLYYISVLSARIIDGGAV